MSTHHPYPYRHVTPEELQELVRRAHAERAEVIRSFFFALFRREPAAEKTVNEPSLGVGACR
jgi:hypothetical protein